MSKERSTKRGVEMAKREKAARKQERRTNKPDGEADGLAGEAAAPSSESEVFESLRQLHERFEAGDVGFEEFEETKQGLLARLASGVGAVRKFVIMGVQGSGKGTQAKLLADDLELEHISVGDIFRWNVQHHTKLGAQVKRIVASGHLVDDDLVESVVRDRLAVHDWNYGFIVDGFPRNARQAEFFLESYDIDGVINLHLDDAEVQRRVLARRLCSQCGLDYNLIAHRPKAENRCDVCSGALVTRADDNPEALGVRLRQYHDETKPLLALFERKEFVVTVDASHTVAEVQAEIRRHFHLPAAAPTPT